MGGRLKHCQGALEKLPGGRSTNCEGALQEVPRSAFEAAKMRHTSCWILHFKLPWGRLTCC
eukprot:2609236-Pyramimonas_sp.AAC.1